MRMRDPLFTRNQFPGYKICRDPQNNQYHHAYSKQGPAQAFRQVAHSIPSKGLESDVQPFGENLFYSQFAINCFTKNNREFSGCIGLLAAKRCGAAKCTAPYGNRKLRNRLLTGTQ
jgi:hypothetical protein